MVYKGQSSNAAILQSANLFVYVMNNPMRFVDPWGLFAEFYIPHEIDGGGGGTPIIPDRVADALGITTPRQPSSNPVVAFGQGMVTGGVNYARSIWNAVTNPVQTATTIVQGINNDPMGFAIGALDSLYFNPMNPWTHVRGFYQGYQAAGFYGMGQHYGAHLTQSAMIAASYGIGYGVVKGFKYLSSGIKISGLDDLLTNPALLSRATPHQWYKYLLRAGHNPQALGRGSLRGVPFESGGGFRVHWGGDRILQFHPGGGHHGISYWKISSGTGGTVRFDMRGIRIP